MMTLIIIQAKFTITNPTYKMCSPVKLPSSNDIPRRWIPLTDVIILARFEANSMIAVNIQYKWHSSV